MFNIGRMVGPAIAGVLLAYVSEAWCFLANTISYGAIIAALLAMRLPPQAPRPAVTGVVPQGFTANLGVLMAFPAVRYLLPRLAVKPCGTTPVTAGRGACGGRRMASNAAMMAP